MHLISGRSLDPFGEINGYESINTQPSFRARELGGVNMSLSNYLSKDFGPSSAATKNLFGRLAEETGRPTLNLTPVYSTNGVPAFLTPAMDGWYRTYVHPMRGRAIEEVSSEFESKSTKK